MTGPFGADIIFDHFPNLHPRQKEQLSYLGSFYKTWNQRINLISRKDIDALFIHHVLHSLAIAKYISFRNGIHVLDVGTGGGFPGIPLSILFPEVRFHLVDSIGKKIKVVQTLISEINLMNATAEQKRAEQLSGSYNFVVSRAVTSLPVMYGWVRHLLDHHHGDPGSGGIIYLKGGDFSQELGKVPLKYRMIDIDRYFGHPFFTSKKLVHLF